MGLNNYELPEKYELTCPECNHIVWLIHVEWFSIVCQSCGNHIKQTDCEIKEIY
jgi:transcription elongation factor Elf1